MQKEVFTFHLAYLNTNNLPASVAFVKLKGSVKARPIYRCKHSLGNKRNGKARTKPTYRARRHLATGLTRYGRAIISS